MPISLWLLPSAAARAPLVASMEQLAAAHGLPSTDAHITLLGNSGDGLTPDEAAARLQALRGRGPVAISLTEVASGTDAEGRAPWNQSCVAVVNETDELIQLQRLAADTFLGAEAAAAARPWAAPLCKPHLSLAYGNAPEVLGEAQLPEPFVADCVAVWDCNPGTLEGVLSWREIARVAL